MNTAENLFAPPARKLKNNRTTPRSGYTYIDPDTGLKLSEATLQLLITTATQHRKANNLHIPDGFDNIIEDRICSMNPPNFSQPLISAPLPRTFQSKPANYSLRSTLNGTIELLKVPGKGTLRLVPQAVAEERARICLACPLNIKDAECYSCKAQGAVIAILGRRKTSQDKFLSTCKVCMCFNKAQVHCDVITLASSTPEAKVKDYPETCWKHKLLKEHYDKPKSKGRN